MDRRLLLLLLANVAVAPWPARANLPPPKLRRLNLTNAHTGETFSGTYRSDKGPIPTVMQELSVFLRDHYSGETTPIDVGLLDFLATVMDAAGATRATVLSAYRTPQTNAMLARTTFGVAEHSQHMFGRAIDIVLPKLEEAMQSARAMKRGGVGWYPDSNFIHLDSGPVRNWTLEGRGFERLLLHIRQLIDKGGLAITESGELVTSQNGRKLPWRQRVAMHKLIARAAAGALAGH